jgi:hypothetical protein
MEAENAGSRTGTSAGARSGCAPAGGSPAAAPKK